MHFSPRFFNTLAFETPCIYILYDGREGPLLFSCHFSAVIEFHTVIFFCVVIFFATSKISQCHFFIRRGHVHFSFF